MSKITFLFGAGAEGKHQYGLPSGADFNVDLLVSKNGFEFFKALNKSDILDSKHKNSRNIYWNNYSSLYYLYSRDKGFRDLLNDQEKSICEEYQNYKNENDAKNANEDFRYTNFRNLFKDRFYKKIIDNDIENDYALKYFLENSILIDNLDASFNALSCPETFKNEVQRVIKCYCSAYFSIYKILYGENVPKDRNDIINSISNPPKYFKENEDSYYSIIKRLINDYNDIEFAFTTTNYTRIAETVIGNKQSFSYIHGRMDLFENLKTKEVKTLNEFEESDIVFPYIAIRSGIKPIINSTQIKEWYRFVKDLEESDVLIIVGYGFNNDDEHITNIIRETISKKSIKIYQTDFNGDVNRTNSIPGINDVQSIKCDSFEKDLNEICEGLMGNKKAKI